MKAARFYGGKTIRVEQVPDPVPAAAEVVVRVRAAGICGSDLHGYRDPGQSRAGPSRPRLSGHELAGEVAAVGPSVEGVMVGQRVGVEPRHLVGCGRCRWCQRGDYQLCPSLGCVNGQRVHSTGFAELSLESALKCYPLPDELPMEAAAILDVYAVAVHALHRVPVRPMDTVVVLGTGAIGLATAQVARAAGARRVVVVGRRDAPLAVVRQLGCEGINAARVDLAEAVRSLTDGQGADVVYEAVGGRAATLGQALDVVARGGQVCIVGAYVETQHLDPRTCMRKEVSLHWAWSYGMWEGVPEFQIALEMMADGRVDPASLITHRYPLGQIGAAFAAADDKRASGAIKVLVIP
jgi:threonine dehydrogenase-like Zn-dependent dehydrogenase